MFSYQEWSKRKFWTVMTGTLILGMFISPSGSAQVASEVDTKPATVEVVKEIPVEDREAFDRLLQLDNQIIDEAITVIEAQSEALQLAGDVLTRYDSITAAELEASTSRVQELTQTITTSQARVEQLQAERQTLITN